MAAWLEHDECQLQAVDQVFFAVKWTFLVNFGLLSSIKQPKMVQLIRSKIQK